jgi:hypothetical protein
MCDSIKSSEMAGSLVETHADSQQYEITDCQVSNTSSAQAEFACGSVPEASISYK